MKCIKDPKTSRVSTVAAPHKSYLGVKLTECPVCKGPVQLEKDCAGYEFWTCEHCFVRYLYALPFPLGVHEEITKQVVHSGTTHSDHLTPLTQEKTPTSPTYTTNSLMLSDTGEIPKQPDDKLVRERISKKLDADLSKVTAIKLRPSKARSKSKKPDPATPTTTPEEVCSVCKGTVLTVGSPVTLELRCQDQKKTHMHLVSIGRILGIRRNQILRLNERLERVEAELENLNQKISTSPEPATVAKLVTQAVKEAEMKPPFVVSEGGIITSAYQRVAPSRWQRWLWNRIHDNL